MMELRYRFVTLLGVLLKLAQLCSPQERIFPSRPSVTLPGGASLMPSAILTCGLTPTSLAVRDYRTRWITPTGETVVSTDGRYILNNGPVPVNGTQFPGTVLAIQNLSYQDAGQYTCEGQATNATDPNALWITAKTDLQLNMELLGNTAENRVQASSEDASVELACEMRQYIRPDNLLTWEGPGSQTIINGANRHQIIFTDGLPNEAANGTANLVPSRISTLVISNPEPADAGTYTCMVTGTSQVVAIQLVVNGSVSADPTSGSSIATTSGPAAANDTAQFLPAVIGAVAAFLGLIVIILIIVIIIVSVHRSKSATTTLIADDIHDNGAYESSNGSTVLHRSSAPKYAQIDKTSISPPPLPARPSTNVSHNRGNSVLNSVANSTVEIDKHPPGYETPDIINISGEQSNKYDPYYDNPEEAKMSVSKLNKPSGGSRKYYDEVDVHEKEQQKLYDMTTVPSPADVLNGSLQRNAMDPRNPDFNYPIYNDGFSTVDFDRDYDQIYSEPLDPTMLRHEYDLGSNSMEAIPYSAIYEDPHPLNDSIAPLKVTHSNIIEVRKLGTGQFGHVILARTKNLSLVDLRLSETDTDPSAGILVAIKKLKLDAESCLMEAFEKEVKFMSRLNHDNVVRLLGVCTGEESFIMMEYMENGDLNQFLQKQKLMPDTISGLQENEVTPVILLYMGVQIASGMHYLASRKFVHRDLATRNCLVGKDFVVKISDFGMSRSLYESAYYRVQGTLVLPIRWMACETFYGKFSVKSDAWAFGVTLWEIYTLGKVDPYDDMTDEEVIADAIRGPDRKIPERTEVCPLDVYDIMLRCWVHEPSMRADFGEIYSRLFMIYTRQAL